MNRCKISCKLAPNPNHAAASGHPPLLFHAKKKVMDLSDTGHLCQQLVQRASVTPDDAGCQQLLSARLQQAGFTVEHQRHGDVDNLWARIGTEDPLLILAGHTDVVPTGDLTRWQHDPFSATIDNDWLYGRGAADMKGGLAALVVAAERFLSSDAENMQGSLAFLITSDEEGPAIDGTARVVESLKQRGEKPRWCILGEPSSSEHLGDIVRHGRRGSLGGHLFVQGRQGHVAYPHLADNPVHKALSALDALCRECWDEGNAHFPATTLQISNINAGTGATNIIPGELSVQFNLRYSTATDPEKIKARTAELMQAAELDYRIDWNHSGQPFITEPGTLTDAAQQAIAAATGTQATLDTGGGTSDGRFIATTGAEVIELGPNNATIHQINERVSLSELDTLTGIYTDMLHRLLLPAK